MEVVFAKEEGEEDSRAEEKEGVEEGREGGGAGVQLQEGGGWREDGGETGNLLLYAPFRSEPGPTKYMTFTFALLNTQVIYFLAPFSPQVRKKTCGSGGPGGGVYAGNGQKVWKKFFSKLIFVCTT